jgi:hypothetical protein
MTKKERRRSKLRSPKKKVADLPAGPKARNAKGRLAYKLDRVYVKSWSTSGDA